MTAFQVRNVDCRELARKLPENSVDAIVTDPPYGLDFMGAGWDHEVPGVDFWREFLRITKPGAHLAAFGGTRLYHRMTSAIEDAGWEIRDGLMWLYGTGFPKSKNLDGEFEGWGTALKPAWEPIVLARKPLSEKTVAANVARWRCGAINVEASRVGDAPAGNAASTNTIGLGLGLGLGLGRDAAPKSCAGRWPANVILDEVAGARLDAEAGEKGGGFGVRGAGSTEGRTSYALSGANEVVGYGDAGGPSRFFYCAKASRAEREAGLENAERTAAGVGALRDSGRGSLRANTHPTVKPVALMRWLCRLITPSRGLVFDPFTGSGSTGVAAVSAGFRFVGAELSSEYVEIARARIAHAVASATKENAA